MFVKAGSIVPLGSVVQSTASKQSIERINVYPGANADFVLYDDDGISYDYKSDKGVGITQLHWNDKTRKLSATGDNAQLVRSASKLVKLVGR